MNQQNFNNRRTNSEFIYNNNKHQKNNSQKELKIPSINPQIDSSQLGVTPQSQNQQYYLNQKTQNRFKSQNNITPTTKHGSQFASQEEFEEQQKLQNLKDKNMAKIFNQPSNYRIAHSTKKNIDQASKRFWEDCNKNNKTLLRFQDKSNNDLNQFGRPQSSTVGVLPRFNQKESLVKDQVIGATQKVQSGDFYNVDLELEQAAHLANSQVTFQRNIVNQTSPYSFLSSVGGKQADLSDFTKEYIDKDEIIKQKQKDDKYQVTAQETLNVYKKIDIDKSLKQQITITQKSKQQSRPKTVSTINKIDIQNMIKESKNDQYDEQQQMQEALNQQIIVQKDKVSRIGTAQPQRRIQSAVQGKRPQFNKSAKQSNKDLQPIQRPISGRPQSGKRVITGKSQNSNNQTRQQSGKEEIIKAIQDNNQRFMDYMNQDNQESFIQEDMEDDQQGFYKQADQLKLYNKNQRPKSSLHGKRPISGHDVGPQQFFQKFQKFTTFNSSEIPFENLFDRNERTRCATFAKFGDLGFYSPVQRIGSYMEYNAKLKISHLIQIITLQKTITNVEKNDYLIPIQLSIVDDLEPQANSNKSGISTTFCMQDYIREPVTLSLYPEYFDDENDDQITTTELAARYFIDMLNEMGGVYDPEQLGKKNYTYIDPSIWPESIQKKVASSVQRYEHYLNSDIINSNEIPKFQKEWLLKSINQIHPDLLQNEQVYREVFNDIFENFKKAMKKAMLDYVLLSPLERARLHIELIPRPYLCSAQRIAREGGFNIKLFDDWHKFVERGREKCKSNLVQMNIINSSLTDWFQDFSHFRLIEADSLKQMKILNHTLSISEFIKLQEMYRINVCSMLKYVWHRGCIVIIKKFKNLRRYNQNRTGKWTFIGYEQKRRQPKKRASTFNIQQQFENFEIDEQAEYEEEQSSSYNDEQYEQLMGIRKNTNNPMYYDIQENQSSNYYGDYQDIQEFGIVPNSLQKLKQLGETIEEENQIRKLTSAEIFKEMVKFFIEENNENHEFDFLDDIVFEDLPDIRENPAYKILANLAMEDEQVWKEENGWKLYTKEYRARILQNVGVQMGLQLRKIVEESVKIMEDMFLEIPTLQQWKDEQSSLDIDVEQSQQDQQESQVDIPMNQSNSQMAQSQSRVSNRVNNSNPKKHQTQIISTLAVNKSGMKDGSFLGSNPKQSFLNVSNMAYSRQSKNNNTSQNNTLLGNYQQQAQEKAHSHKIPLDKLCPPKKQLTFKKPEFMKLKTNFKSQLNIEMIINGQDFQFKENSKMIREQLLSYYKSMITSLNHFLHPNICKVKVNQDYNPQEQHQNQITEEIRKKHVWEGDLNLETTVLIDQFDDFYRQFSPFVQITEKQGKSNALFGTQQESNKNQEELADKLLSGIGVEQKNRYIQVLHPQEEQFQSSQNKIINHILSHFEECQIAFQVFNQFTPFVTNQARNEIKVLIDKKAMLRNEELKQYHDILTKYQKLLEEIPDHIYMPLFDINCEGVKNQLYNIIDDLKKKLEQTHEETLQMQMKQITDKYNEISSEIRKVNNTADDVENMEKYISDLLQERISIKQKTTQCFQKLNFIIKLDVKLDEIKHLFDLAKDLNDWPQKLDKELAVQERQHGLEREKLENELKEQRFKFLAQCDAYSDRLEQFKEYTEYKLHGDYIKQVQEFEKVLQDAQELMESIIDQESKLFGYPTNYEKFGQLQKNFEPFSKLWKSINFFVESQKKWYQDPIANLEPTEIEVVVKEYSKVANKLVATFKNDNLISQIADKFKRDVQEMNHNLNAIEVISRPGLKDRHWADISNILGMKQIDPQEQTLQQLKQNKLDEFIKEVEEISENSSKEFSLETALDKMEKEWEKLCFVVLDYKNRGIKILQGAAVEEIQILLDDHTLKAQTIKQNPNIKFMESRATRWEEQMTYTQQVIEVWIKVQTLYLYLEPIFSYEDISKTLKTESEKFAGVDQTWKEIMEVVEQDPNVLNCIRNINGLLGKLNSSLNSIEEIQKGLEEHLESKRLDFPRFFFLSNDDLLNILAETKDPLLVQPHMKKCFEGISELIFNNNVDIVGMKSSENEEISFIERIAPRNFKSNVEKWLLKVQDQMQESLKKIMEDSLIDLKANLKKRENWLKRWPGQIILGINQLNWTESVEQALMSGKTGSLSSYYTELESQKDLIVSMVRGNLSMLEMLTLGALIVIAVHNNDVVKELIEDNIKDVNAFEWQAQMRYVWNQDSNVINVKMMSTSMEYGYEYLGNTTRLVITPLTDRCYRTLMSALHLNLGGAPEGPAGTGKTETTKDLGKALAIQCIVFNCSDGLNIHSMAKFFKGLISAGAWSCFDEFNRIDVEVLSVIAQQILQIQQSKALKKTHIQFYGTNLPLIYSCSVFITMNPGYAGRSELPDNLKALFRPVAMMVPNYALIAEIQLYSFGFLDARSLAQKIVIVYKLCSEQLSSQDHYDYGMRAVKAVLTAAQQLKRKYPQEKEDVLVLRSICDVNIPKFLTQDLSLFNGITSDLFPNTTLPNPEYTVLNNAMNQVLAEKNLQIVANFKKKVLQLYEVVNTRHGLMIVGQPFAGKSTCYKVLASTLGQAKILGANESVTYYHVINPKSVNIKFLYGDSDPVSKEWTEGVLSDIYRKCANNTAPDRQFLVFDGPVDAEWIENMNTVLDDNKKLCLNNGETIAMTNYMTMMFEVADLKQASPATVSRCGMVYMQPDQLGWKPIFQSWLNNISENIEENVSMRIDELFDAFVDRCVHYAKHKCKEYQGVPEASLVVALMRLFESHLKQNKFLDRSYVSRLKPEDVINRIDMLFLWSLVWTIAGTIDSHGRKNFDKFFKKIIKEPINCPNIKNKLVKIEKSAQIPDAGSNILVYDYFVQTDDFLWKKWQDYLESNTPEIPNEATFNSIVIPTVEMLRLTDLVERYVYNNIPLMLIGPTGTGKSTYINKYIKDLPMDKFSLIFVNFSAQTSVEKTQEIIDNRLDRRRKGQYGPKLGMKCLVYIDDINMPQYDKYGAQPPIELIRQFLDHGGWYGKDRNMMQLIDTQLLCSQGPPGGGRNPVTTRFLRHFNVLCTIESDTQELTHIFGSLMKWHIQKQDIPAELQEKYVQCIEGSIDMYSQICQNLKPTPAKNVYLFNLRDLSRAVQGIMLLERNQLNEDGANMKISRLWINELNKVFFDRLIFEEDKTWYYNTLISVIRNKLKDDIKNIMKGAYDHYNLNLLTTEPLKVIRFGEVMASELEEFKPYDEITNLKPLSEKLEFFLEDYNQNTKRPMHLVLFEFAIDHILRIVRILRTQQGHSLLIGLGGSGRQSSTQLAAHIRDIQLFSVEMTKSYSKDNWIEDMQKLLITAGAEHKEIVFMINDSQIQQSFILEDLNNLLNTGDIPSLFSQEDFIPLIDKLRTKAKKEGRMNLVNNGNNEKFYDYFIECVKRKLHVVLVMSPIGDSLRNRIRMFPNIINCTTIIQYKQWPEEGLEAVAHKLISEMYLDHSLQRKLVTICKKLHATAIDLSTEYLKKDGRHNYITPSSYLELLNNLKEQLHQQRQKLEEKRNIYSNGVQKILTTSAQVKTMEEELVAKRPVLIQMNQETQEIAAQIQEQVKSMEPKKNQVEQETAMVQVKVDEAEKINAECEADLSVAKPKLEQAEKALDRLDPNDVVMLKNMQKPPNTVRLVMEAVCIFLEIPPVKVGRAGMPKEKMYDYWESSKKLLQEKDFLLKLIKYDKNSIKPEIMKKIRDKYVTHADFNPKRVEKASNAAKGFCEWILAMDEYEKVLTNVKPKIERYNESQATVNQLQSSLQKTQAELDLLNNEIKKLQDQYNQLKQKQEQLENDINECEKKLIRAESIIGGLGGEQERWKVTSAKLEERLEYINGDVVISTAIVSYLGNFISVYRHNQIEQWTALVKECGLLVSDNYSLENTIGEAIIIRRWQMYGLPSDTFSTENGIITYTTKRWPLFIDPQGQAARWIKNNEQDNKVIVTKQSDSGFIRQLENSITFGQVLIIENVKEEIDSLLDPILAKQTFKNAGVLSIKIGDNIVDYSKNFKLFLMSKLRNPHFTPEISTKMTLVNFGITKEGLIDQLLELCVQKEEPEDGEMRSKLIVQGHKNNQQLEELEAKILDVLNKADNILEDEEGVKVLQQSKEISNEIEEKQQIALEVEERIETSRQEYKPIAVHSAVLFFTLMDMAHQDFMYQYSLAWFINLYQDAFDKSQKGDEVSQRVKNVIDYFTYQFYCNVCRSLFEKDKLLFSFLLQIRILENKHFLDHDEFKFFITPTNIDNNDPPENPCQSWMPENTWLKFVSLSGLSRYFSHIQECIENNSEEWKKIYFDPNAHQAKFPIPYHDCTSLQRLCILKCIRPDRIVRSVVDFIKNDLGEKFTQPPPFNLQLSFGDSNWFQPLVFVLPGTDPMTQLISFSQQREKELESISLGQGQGILAEKAIRNAKENGSWVILQNCHLAPSWMPKLEKICEEMIEFSLTEESNKQNAGFRLFLTSYPTNAFPVSILQNSVKMTNEPPKGLKSNLTVSYMSDQIQNQEFFEQHSKPKEFKSLLYGLCLFHAILQERRTFGPLGWNIHYDFNQSDLRISVRQLHLFMNIYDFIPYKALHYMIGECNYGGRVTDDRDRRILHALMDDFFSEQIFQKGFTFAKEPAYPLPTVGKHEQYLNFINKLPEITPSQLFGFHENGEIVKDLKETDDLCTSLLLLTGGSSGSSEDVDQEAKLKQLSQELLDKLPKKFDTEITEAKYPIDYKNSMNTVLLQEILRYNNLTNIIKNSLIDIQKALEGTVVMSESLEEVGKSLSKGLVPNYWKKNSYPSLKPLGSYMKDLVERLLYFHQWIDNVPHTVHWISGYYFTQSFLTATSQNYARKYSIPIDTLKFDFAFYMEPQENVQEQGQAIGGIEDGSLIYGLYLEGCKWDYENNQLQESEPKVLHTKAPIIFIKPVEITQQNNKKSYACPVYKTSERRGTLSTTGHSTNWIMNIDVNTDKDQLHWVKRGVAMLTQLSE